MLKEFIKNVLSYKLKNIIIFESNPDFSDNTYYFFKYLVEEKNIQSEYKLVWFVKNNESKCTNLCGADIVCVNQHSDSIFEKFKRIYYNAKAKYIIDCNECIYKYSDKQIKVYLTHGMPIKNVEMYLRDCFQNSDFVPVTSSFYKEYFEKICNRDIYKVCGFPRNEILYSQKNSGIAKEDKFIIWMPTYRQHSNPENLKIANIFPLGIPVLKSQEDCSKLNECLKQLNMKLLFRPHPVQDLSILNLEKYSNIILADDFYLKEKNIQLYDLLAMSNALITDYSSVYVDYYVLNRPIGLTLEDYDEYTTKWPLIFDNPNDYLIGCKMNDVDDMIKFVKDVADGIDEYETKRSSICDLYNEIAEPIACKLIYDSVFENPQIDKK